MRVLAFALSVILAGSATAETDMSSLWPNEDGLLWEYEQTYTDDLWWDPETIVNQARFYFDGYDEVPGGIEVQNLVGEASPPLNAMLSLSDSRPGGVCLAVEAPAAIHHPLLRSLWRARPDLRDTIESKAGDPGLVVDNPPDFYQILLHGAAYKKSEEDIAAYRRDQEAMKSWLWLVADLTIGNTFELQLVPDLADDVWLYGTIAAWEDVEVPAGDFLDCLRVDYRINYGESICTDENGNETGAFTGETQGFIHYAPYVGPINTYEEFIPITEILWGECEYWGQYVGEPATSGSLKLIDHEPVRTERTSWGAIKVGYQQSEARD